MPFSQPLVFRNFQNPSSSSVVLLSVIPNPILPLQAPLISEVAKLETILSYLL